MHFVKDIGVMDDIEDTGYIGDDLLDLTNFSWEFLIQVTFTLRSESQTEHLIEVSKRIQDGIGTKTDKNIIRIEIARLMKYMTTIPEQYQDDEDYVNLSTTFYIALQRNLDSVWF